MACLEICMSGHSDSVDTVHYSKSLRHMCRGLSVHWSYRFGHRWSDGLCCSIGPGLVGVGGSVGAGLVIRSGMCEGSHNGVIADIVRQSEQPNKIRIQHWQPLICDLTNSTASK